MFIITVITVAIDNNNKNLFIFGAIFVFIAKRCHFLLQYQQENKENNDVNKLSHVFCHVVMKPPWESIEYVDH